MGKIRVGIVGIGNAASTLIQLLHLVKSGEVEGILHWDLGGYKPTDIEVVAAYDIDRRKVGKDLSEAIFSEPNNMIKLTDVPTMGVHVEMGILKDELGFLTRQIIEPTDQPPVNLHDSLKEKNVDILVNLISGFATRSSENYAKIAAESKVGFINCTPSIIASNHELSDKFKNNGVPVVGDDLLSQIGSTALHKAMLEWLNNRGAKIVSTYALDVGGNPETFGSLELRSRLVKRHIKSDTIKAATPYEFPVMAQPMDYVDFLGDQRDTVIYIQAKFIANADIGIEVKIRVPDSLNAFNPLIDAIRVTKLALDRGVSGALESVSAFLFKHPPKSMPLSEAEKAFWQFVKGEKAV